jgi:hypothetical protein
MKLKFFLFSALVLGLIFAFAVDFFSKSTEDKKENIILMSPEADRFMPPTPITPETTPFIEKDLSKAYQMGYEKGYYSFLIQSGQDPEKISTYTVSVEGLYKEQESQDYHDAVEKGYVDGYHKACDSVNCPRSSIY